MKTLRELEEANMRSHYWDLEEPEVFDFGKNVIRYFPQAGRLVVHLPDFYNVKSGRDCVGKGVGIQLDAFAEQPEKAKRIIEILQDCLQN